MTRSLIATVLAGAIGLGAVTPALADDWRHAYDWRDRNRDGVVDWRDRYHPQDRNRDGVVDWRDRDRNHDGVVNRRDRYDPRDRNYDGRVDWRDRYDPRDRNYDGRVDWRDGYGHRDGYGPSLGAGASCTFQSSRGPIAGYQPPGKDRCCIQTSQGPSCQ